MDAQSKSALVKCSFDIKKNITSVEEVMDKLLQKGCLSWEERSRIGREKPVDLQCQSLLEILIRRGGKSYDSFLDALTATENKFLVDAIEKAFDEPYTKQKKTATLGDSLGKKENALIRDSCEDTLVKIHKIDLEDVTLEKKLKRTKEELIKIKEYHARALENLSRTQKDNGQKDDKIKQLKTECEEMKSEIERLKQELDYLEKEILLKEGALQRAEVEKRETAKAFKRLENQQEETQETCGKILQELAALSKAFHESSHSEPKRKQEVTDASTKNQQTKPSCFKVFQKYVRPVPNKMSKCSNAGNEKQKGTCNRKA